ncbi:PapD-like protein [Abortiporus biennis]|nr:PapD-like protein [Abortiporus biennis]
MSVVINPSSTLGFNRPFTQHVKRALFIANNNTQPVAFKVKTTAPKLYSVRPNSGRVEPGETIEVQVMLQAMKEDPPLNAKCKDKFLIQSTIITPEKETMPLLEIWNTEGEEIHSQKLRVAYLPPEGQTVQEEDESQANMSSLMNVSDSQFNTVRQAPQINGHTAEPTIPEFPNEETTVSAPVSPPPAPVAVPEPQQHVTPPTPPPTHTEVPAAAPPPHEEPQESPKAPAIVQSASVRAPEPPSPSSPVRAPAPIRAPASITPSHSSTSIPDPNAELVAKLHEAQAEIERLRSLISSMPDSSSVAPTALDSTVGSSEIRRRQPRSIVSDDDASTIAPETEIGSYVEEHVGPVDGVPLQVVIAIALGVFVTTYLFF